MSNPFEIAANATMPELLSTLNLVVKAPRPGPKLKSLAERKSIRTIRRKALTLSWNGVSMWCSARGHFRHAGLEIEEPPLASSAIEDHVLFTI
jgi:hypothetical protein